MKRIFCLFFCITFVGMTVMTSCAADVQLTLKPEQELNRIDGKVYSQFLEHIYHSVNGGLWGELVWNRSFEDNQQGGWSQENGVISQKSPGVDQRLTFGDTNWSDYEYTLEAQKTGGAEGFLVLFRVQSDKDFSWVNLGGWQNKQHAIERRNAVNVKQNRQGVVSPMIDGSIETGKWYTIKVRCEGDNVKVSLDGKQILDVTDSYMAKTGCVGIGTWSTQAKFRNFKVTSLDGKTVLFNETPKVSQPLKIRHWEPFGGAKISINTTDAFNGRSCVQITQGGGVQHEGFIQKKIDGIQQGGFVLKKDETYLFSIGIKSNDVTMPRIECRFYDRQQNKIVTCSTSFIDNYVRGQWTKISGKFWDLSDDVSDGILMLTLDPGLTVNEGTYLIDQISIMPKSWAENGGFRPDLLKAIADLKPALIRWPGGCFASAYRWKDGIGPQEKRQPYPFSIWDDREVNSFGTDEYIAMCRRVGCEPHIVINAGTPSWNAKRTPETANVDWVQEACDWVEYCNGPATSKWGKVRAENGHPEPYNVKHWEIDNETQGNLTVDEYIATIKKFVPAMKKVDPTIKIAVAGSHYGPRGPWDNPIINQAGELIDYISFHQYDDPNKFADGPGKIETYFRELQKVIAQSPNKNIKIFDSEWNAQSTDWRTGLYCGGILNVFERCGDVVEIAAPALFLRHKIATDWDNAFVNFDNKSWYPAPNYVVMKLWHDHFAPIRIGLDGDAKNLNVVATKSEDGKTLYLKAVNPTNEACTVTLNVDAKFENASMKLVTAQGLNDRNTLENPTAIAPKDGTATIEGKTVRFELPAYSAGVVTIQ